MIAIIPARGGSKGLPGKNIKPLYGKPLIAYTIEAAKKSIDIDRIIVSTDDQEIANIAREYGAEIPFMRPAEISTDRAKAIDVYIFTVSELNKGLDKKIDDFIVLQPTSPLRSSLDIDKAIEIFINKSADSVISVVEAEHPPQWYKNITSEGILKDYFNSDNSLNRQEYSKTYIPNGAIYVFKYSILISSLSYYTDRTYPYIMTPQTSIDIDTILDFRLAEFILSGK